MGGGGDKRENAGFLHFLIFKQCLQQFFSPLDSYNEILINKVIAIWIQLALDKKTRNRICLLICPARFTIKCELQPCVKQSPGKHC